MLLKATLFMILLTVTSSCQKKSESTSPTGTVILGSNRTCPSGENLSIISSVIALANGDSIAQRASMSGQVGVSINIQKVTMYLSSAGLTSITLTVYKDDHSGIFDPTLGTFLGQSVINSGLGSASSSTPIEFAFTPEIPVAVGTSIYFVLNASGSGFNISYAMPSMLGQGGINTKSGANWVSFGTNNASLSMSLTYNGCTGL